MKNLYKKISIVLMLFAVFIMTAPAQLAFANQKNKMIDEGYFDNPETFNQDSTAVKESANS